MRIAQLAPQVEAVPPKGYGGTELVVSLLTEELIARGHQVTLFASGDSCTSARLISAAENSLRSDRNVPVSRWPAYELRLLLKLKEMLSEFDLVHNHLGYLALPFLSELGIATLTTMHNPVKDYNAEIYLAYADMPYASISNAYRRLNYPERLNYLATVYNGIDCARFANASEQKRNKDYLLFLGRVCKDKGTADAVKIARAVGMPLKIAGKVDIADQDYFQREVEPFLGNGIEFVSEVNEEQKLALYTNAYALVYPIAFEEPFGLVMAEALASGLPLLALARGSVNELLTDRETAVVASSIDELIKRFDELEKIDPAACRERAAGHFSKEAMTSSYEKVYGRLLEESRAAVRVLAG